MVNKSNSPKSSMLEESFESKKRKKWQIACRNKGDWSAISPVLGVNILRSNSIEKVVESTRPLKGKIISNQNSLFDLSYAERRIYDSTEELPEHSHEINLDVTDEGFSQHLNTSQESKHKKELFEQENQPL